MAREDLVQIDGTIKEVQAGGHYLVELENGQLITARLSGRLRKFYIRVMLGDKVTIGLSPYDPSHGLIVRREKLKGGPPRPGGKRRR